MNSRAEKPNVPTPDAASVYAHHLSQMSRPMRVAVERYVASLEASNEHLMENVNPADVCCPCDSCGTGHFTRRALCTICDNPETPEDVAVQNEHLPNPDPTKQRMRDEQDALLAGYARERELADRRYLDVTVPEPPDSPAAGAVALPDGWRWDASGSGFTLHAPGAWVHSGKVDINGCWRRHDGEWRTATPPTLAAAQAALVLELRSRGVLPAAAASADVHGLGSEWVPWVSGDVRGTHEWDEAWRHKTGAVIGLCDGRWWAYPPHDDDAVGVELVTAADAARLALGTVVEPDRLTDLERRVAALEAVK